MTTIIRPGFRQAEDVKPLINVGACIDLATGFFIKGIHGENLLLGGIGMLNGVTGGGNTFKSTIMHYLNLASLSRTWLKDQSFLSTYDTEINIQEDHLRQFTARFDFDGVDIITEGIWNITDSVQYKGEEWFEVFKQYTNERKKHREKLLVATPFLNRERTGQYMMMIPTFTEIDSFTQFMTSSVIDQVQDKQLGDSSANMQFAHGNKDKVSMMNQMPNMAGGSGNYISMSAHYGKDVISAAGPYAPPPPKRLPTMKPGEKVKGFTDAAYFLMTTFLQAMGSTPLVADDKKGPYYPKSSDDRVMGDSDLHVVRMKVLRCKSFKSGTEFPLIVSQSEGVLPELTEFYNLKQEKDGFGFEGNVQNYALNLTPDIKLSRTTVRGKLDDKSVDGERLRRAMNVTSEINQLRNHHQVTHPNMPSMEELRDGLKKNGYDLDFILKNTRGWWRPNNDSHKKLYCSSVDMVEMSRGTYHPYWMEDDRSTVKKEFAKDREFI